MGQITQATLVGIREYIGLTDDYTASNKLTSKLNLSLEKMSSSAHANKTESGAVAKAFRNNACTIFIVCVMLALIAAAVSLVLIGGHSNILSILIALIVLCALLLMCINLLSSRALRDTGSRPENIYSATPIHAEIDTAEEPIYEEIGPAEENIYEEPIHAEIDGAMFAQQPVYSLLGEHVNGAMGAQQPVYSLLGESTGPIGPFEQSIYSLLAERGNIKLHRHKDS